MPKKKRKGGGGSAKRRGSLFQSTPWTKEEAEEVFSISKDFRSLALQAARKIHKKTGKNIDGSAMPPKLEDAKRLAAATAAMSKSVGDELSKGGQKRYPHPVLIVAAIIEMGEPGRFESGSIDDRTASAIGAMLVNYRPGMLAAGAIVPWAEFTRGITEAHPPFFIRKSIHDLRGAKGAVNGFRLRKIRCRIPVGNQFVVVEKGKEKDVVSKPAGFRYYEADLTAPHFVEKFGEVWVGVSEDGRSIFFASQKGATAMTLSEFVEASRSTEYRQTRSSYAFLRSADMRKVREELPDRLKYLLREKAKVLQTQRLDRTRTA